MCDQWKGPNAQAGFAHPQCVADGLTPDNACKELRRILPEILVVFACGRFKKW